MLGNINKTNSIANDQENLKNQNDHLQKEIEQLKTQNDVLLDELVSRMKDSVTGLRGRKDFYEGLEKIITDTIEGIPDDFTEKLKQLDVSIFVSDMSYLSLANEIGHKGGDELLRSFGEAAREAGSPKITKEFVFSDFNKGAAPDDSQKFDYFEVNRAGGDEFCGRATAKQIEEKTKLLAQKFSEQSVPTLEKYKLSPNIDIGIAHLPEAVDAYERIKRHKAESGSRENIITKEVVRKITDIFFEIAERRSVINKCIKRVELLMNLKKGEEYDRLGVFLKKGACNISDKEVDELIKIKEDVFQQPESEKSGGKKWNKTLMSKVKELINRHDETEKTERDIVRGIADKDFFNGENEENGEEK